MELLNHKAFLRFWIARLAGAAATQILMLAIGWHMYRITGSAWDLGLVGLLQFAPAMLMTSRGAGPVHWHVAKAPGTRVCNC